MLMVLKNSSLNLLKKEDKKKIVKTSYSSKIFPFLFLLVVKFLIFLYLEFVV